MEQRNPNPEKDITKETNDQAYQSKNMEVMKQYKRVLWEVLKTSAIQNMLRTLGK